jgi:hypothetical protein
VLTGWAGYRMVREAAAASSPINGQASASNWKIQAKQVNLIDCDQCIRNPSIIL